MCGRSGVFSRCRRRKRKLIHLDKSKNYIVVCRSGGRSGMAARFLEQQGYSVTNMTGGMMEWKGETV
ncbi:rhodanese-like domain-containing protein [Priestia megaterium]|nr:rhodanese-like domain-containing protein [Priestia megaterium]MBD8844020.1 rhodanese-like domain-containing protein [Priestia megaterium]MBU8585451.1 rhodanese-like domain-containing protein [Priestia megaterium]PEA41567.1 rhodanese-like domain-containing protein [Priestia megaterium]PEE48732.1 rhodanese-like domain-containing protein [Priestia megaterium]